MYIVLVYDVTSILRCQMSGLRKVHAEKCDII